MQMKRVFLFGLIAASLSILGTVLLMQSAHAAEPTGEFSLQVTPSPIVTTVKPGEVKELELKIHNTGSSAENLIIQPRSFHYDSTSGEPKLDENTPPEIASWITFANPTFSLKAGDWFTQKIKIDVPKQAGFSYSFVMMIKRAQDPNNPSAGRQLKGTVAVFALLNVDRPGATRKLEITDVSTTQQIYEFLPVTIKVRFKNTGNTIIQPYGNIFVQRESTDSSPISTLPVNQGRGYLLPSTERVLSAEWKEGFAVYETKTDASGNQVKYLKRNPDKLSQFRIGKYTAKIVAVYNDGTRDVPIEKVVTFWVVPWRAIGLSLLVIIGLIFLSRFFIKRKTEKAVKKALASRKTEENS